jgi:hypothetical protein
MNTADMPKHTRRQQFCHKISNEVIAELCSFTHQVAHYLNGAFYRVSAHEVIEFGISPNPADNLGTCMCVCARTHAHKIVVLFVVRTHA